MSTPKIVVVGTGYWGKNHVRNFHQLGALSGIYDSNHDAAQSIAKSFSVETVYRDYKDVLADSEVQGAVISSPAETHYPLAKEALSSGKDVLVEKPLALHTKEARELVQLAETHDRVLMTGHLLHYHPAVQSLKELLAKEELGQLEYIYSNRTNLGKIRREENILWSFAPHDISLMIALIGSMPVQTNAVGGAYLQPNIADSTITTFLFPGGVRGHIYVSWLHPFKEQRLVLVGSKKMIVFNDRAEREEKLMMYEKKVELKDGQYIVEKPEGVPVPFDYEQEPLKTECQHFLDCISSRKTPITDGAEGARVLKVLQSCQRSLEMNGQPVQVLDYHE